MKIIVKKCMSLVFVLLTIAMLCMCAAFFVACDDEPTSDTFDETQSRLLGIDEAYDLGLLSDDDLREIFGILLIRLLNIHNISSFARLLVHYAGEAGRVLWTAGKFIKCTRISPMTYSGAAE